MPAVLIETRKKYNKKSASGLIEAIHSALQESLKTPPYEKIVRLVFHDPNMFLCPTNMSKPEYYTIVSIDIFLGRSIETKRKLYQEIVKNFGALGIPKDHILIVLRENKTENFGVQGGKAASDIKWDFKIDI